MPESIQFKAHECGNSYSIASSCNEEVDALRRFSDGFKIALCVVVDFAYGITIAFNQRLA